MLCCIHPALGMLVQFAIIGYCVARCDVKVLPIFMFCVLSRGNIRLFGGGRMALRMGVTIAPGTFLLIAVFFFVLTKLLTSRYDARTMGWGVLWLLSFIPASIMSFTGRANGLVGLWSISIMDALIPGLYFWAVSAGRTYWSGRDYLYTRLLVVLAVINLLCAVRIAYVFTFIEVALVVCSVFYGWRFLKGMKWKVLAVFAFVFSMIGFVFGRAFALQQQSGYVTDADKYGSTFSRMGVVAASIFFSWLLSKRLLAKFFLSIAPIAAVAVNLLFVSYVLHTQAGTESREVNWYAETLEERITAKVFGDRAGVWKMGWEEVKTPPYFIKDLRMFHEFDRKSGGWRIKLYPHNQFLTLLGRHGFWLGLTLALWIIAVWMRALENCHDLSQDDPMRCVYLPVGMAIFCVIGISGQAVVSSDLWACALVAIVLPGVAYGHLKACRPMRGFQSWRG